MPRDIYELIFDFDALCDAHFIPRMPNIIVRLFTRAGWLKKFATARSRSERLQLHAHLATRADEAAYADDDNIKTHFTRSSRKDKTFLSLDGVGHHAIEYRQRHDANT